MSIETLFERMAVALEGIHDTLVADRLDRQRGGAGTPGHVESAGMVDSVIARKLDTKDVQLEMEKLDRLDLLKELRLLGEEPSKKVGDKRLRKMLVDAIMTKKAQDDVYGKSTTESGVMITLPDDVCGVRVAGPKSVVAQQGEEAQDAGTTESVVATPAGNESTAKTTSSPAEPAEPVVAAVHVEEVSMEQVKKTCLAFVQSVHGGDVIKGQAALAAIIHKFNPNYSQLKDIAPKHRAAFHEEVLNA